MGGDVRKVLENCLFQNNAAAYDEAWDVLNQRYGDLFSVGQAFRERLFSWPKISSNDSKGIQDLAGFLRSFRVTMHHVPSLQSLKNSHESQRIITRLPDWMISRWNRIIFAAIKNEGNYPLFVDFVAEEAEIACNPIFSLHALKGLSSTVSAISEPATTSHEARRGRASALATTSTNSSDATRPQCSFCQRKGHKINKCFSFIAKTLAERTKFIRDNRLCFGCLTEGHFTKECQMRQTCDVCKRRHPSCLHDEDRMTGVKDVESAVSLSVNGSGVTSSSTVVPVWISTLSHPGEEILVYALLDTQSDTRLNWYTSSMSDRLGRVCVL